MAKIVANEGGRRRIERRRLVEQLEECGFGEAVGFEAAINRFVEKRKILALETRTNNDGKMRLQVKLRLLQQRMKAAARFCSLCNAL